MENLINKNMTIGDVVSKYPQTARIMQEYGLHCIGCHVNPYETIEQGALGHGMPTDVFDEMLQEVNHAALNPQENGHEKESHSNGHSHHGDHKEAGLSGVTLTSTAVQKLLEFKKGENKGSEFGLRVAAMPGGCAGFMYQLEFDKKNENDEEFDQDGIKVIVNKDNLHMLKGVTIDFVDSMNGSGFKIENPNASSGCGCGKSFH